MGHRIEIELTGKQTDSTWTWRAAGARLPKGTLDASLLYEGAKQGDVVRAEAESGLDGTEITSVLPPAQKSGKQVERIEILGRPKEFKPVTATLAKKKPRRGDDRRNRKPRDGEARKPREGGGRPPRERAPRILPKMKYRTAALDALEGREREIGELLLKGGLQAVRQSLEAQGIKDTAPLMTAAEDLWPTLKTADWMDRAEAALEVVDTASLRDLRAIVSTADANARTDESREMAKKLREALDTRVNTARDTWIGEIQTAINEKKLMRALRLTSRPPDPSVKFPAELAKTLTEATNAALSAETPVDEWLSILEAATVSSVRRQIVPSGLPAPKDDPRLAPAMSAAAKIPSLVQMFGISIPPPPTGRIAPPRPPKPRAPKPRAPKQEAEVESAPQAEKPKKPVAKKPAEEKPAEPKTEDA